MLIAIPAVFSPKEVKAIRAQMDAALWVDGKVTAGEQSAKVKTNEQLAADSPLAIELGNIILTRLAENPLFLSAALPNTIFPPLFNRYCEGADFGIHVDNSIRQVPGTAIRMRTDLSATLFFSDPDEYEGGELIIEDGFGTQQVKLPAGHMVLYPSTSLHKVSTIKSGQRVASFFWLQSLIADNSQREILYDLDQSIQKLTIDLGSNHAEVVRLSGVYHNLVRRWANT
ncbi:PKHD-type hydroxylase [Alteromonadaceae bacterium Bs31]|nr:PKHD-type hydroxylase [Alteromonadaceae bacterium Bs31]